MQSIIFARDTSTLNTKFREDCHNIVLIVKIHIVTKAVFKQRTYNVSIT